jgi:hypothetical protein
MRVLKDAFLVTGAGSTLSFNNSKITDNSIDTERWSGITVRDGAMAVVSRYTFARNRGVEFALSSIATDSTLEVTDSFITNNEGVAVSNFPSAGLLALSKGSASLERTQLVGNTGFSVSFQTLD